MDILAKRALGGTVLFQLVLALLIFGPALSLGYWQGWIYWMVFFACTLSINAYFLRHDRALIERRLRAGPLAETQVTQKIIQSLAALLMGAVFVVSAFDHHNGWSNVPWLAAVAADVLVIASFALMFVVFRENSFAASTIMVAADQRVVSTGPYAVVRHPMYSGALVLFLATPIALGSWWGLLPAILLVGVLVWRLLDEEDHLAHNLSGYRDYQNKVGFRLVPSVW